VETALENIMEKKSDPLLSMESTVLFQNSK